MKFKHRLVKPIPTSWHAAILLDPVIGVCICPTSDTPHW